MEAGQIGFFVIMGLLVLSIVAVIVDSLWRGRKGKGERMPERIEFEVGDKVIELNTGEKGTVARLCADKDIVYVRWDISNQQEMVETKSLKRG